MAISLLTAVKIIPWGEVLSAAPAIVKGADKLWQSITKRKSAIPDGETGAGAAAGASRAPVDVRLDALEFQVTELRKEAIASSELIRNLAEQNVRLVEAVGNLLVRTRILLGLSAFLALTSGAALVLILTR